MNILFIAPSAYLLGGVQIWLDYLLPGLEQRGERVTLGLVDGDHHRAADYLDHHPFHSHVAIANPTGSAEGRVQALMRCIVDRKPDLVVNVNIGDTLEAMARLRRGNGSAAKLAMTLHGIEPDYFGDLSHYASIVDGVIVTNRLTSALVREIAGLDQARCHYAQYGVSETARRLKPPPNSPLRLLWMGRLEQNQKRVLELPAIVKGLANLDVRATLTIAGDGPERHELETNLKQVSAPGVTVDLPGHVPHTTLLSEMLPRCDVLLVNSSWETGPITIWEAMAAGVTVVSSRYVGSGLESSLVDESNCLLFDVGDTSAAVRQLARLAEDPGLGRSLATGATALVGSRYSIVSSADAWHRALATVMAAPPKDHVLLPDRSNLVGGRLDHLFGVGVGERIRRMAGRRFRHESPGGEWPHARTGHSALTGDAFRELAQSLDTATSDA